MRESRNLGPHLGPTCVKNTDQEFEIVIMITGDNTTTTNNNNDNLPENQPDHLETLGFPGQWQP